MNLVISRKPDFQSIKNISSYRIILFRRLTRKEKKFLGEKHVNRYYFSELTKDLSKEFLLQFDQFWANLSNQFDQEHYFWRNSISSKMQEWEFSLSYILLTMYCLKHLDHQNIIIVCHTREEEKVWHELAVNMGWTICNRQSRIKNTIGNIENSLGNTLLFIHKCLKFWKKKKYSPICDFTPDQSGRKNVLIASLFYLESFNNNMFTDPFFGDIHQYFEKNNKRSVYLSDCLSEVNGEIPKKITACSDVKVNLPISILSGGELISLLSRIFFRTINIPTITFLDCDISPIIRSKFRDFRFDFTILAEIYYVALKKMSNKYKFDELLLIYEGNVFERACIQAARETSSAKIIGYSQGVVYPLNLKLKLSEEELIKRPEPDCIVSTGIETKELLLNMGGRDNQNIREGCSLRYIPRPLENCCISPNTNKILIALDGVFSTVSILDWLMEHKEKFDGYELLIRTHPNVPKANLKKYSIYSNFEGLKFSDHSLEEDIKNSMCVFYRQTSVGIQALINGVPAVHLAIDTPLNGDPIQRFNYNKWIINSPDEIPVVLNEIKRKSLIDSREESLNEFLEKYFAQPNENRMGQFMAEN